MHNFLAVCVCAYAEKRGVGSLNASPRRRRGRLSQRPTRPPPPPSRLGGIAKLWEAAKARFAHGFALKVATRGERWKNEKGRRDWAKQKPSSAQLARARHVGKISALDPTSHLALTNLTLRLNPTHEIHEPAACNGPIQGRL